ncbi:MAG: hypothetical protein IPG12_14140 [Saprospiraceae bacterium]|nr:hypothetical protein [Saprospiraceae bacterium]
MKRLLIIPAIIMACLSFLFGQSGINYDYEIYSICMVDSVSPSNQKQIWGLYDYGRKAFGYYTDETTTIAYTPTGTLIPCFSLNGVNECRLRSVSNSSNKRKWQLAISDVSSYHDDIYLGSITYEEFLGSGVGPAKAKLPIPLNYPYGNTDREASRFVADLKDWLDCKGVHYIDSSTWAMRGVYALDFQIHTVRNNWDIELSTALFTINLKDPNPVVLTKTGGNTVVTSVSTEEVCEVFRKEKNGAVYYILPYYSTTPLYPNDASFGLLGRRIDCNYQSNRGDDCDRPASQNCYITKTDSSLCSYYLLISTKDTIQTIWANGTTIPINGNYYATVQPDHKQLQDTIQKWLHNTNKYGKISIENTKNASADGWVISIQYSDVIFDSVGTNRGRYYFGITDCKDYLYFDVTRNELGGVINVINQYGENVICPPEASVMIPCDQMSEIGGCIYKGNWGQEFYNTVGTRSWDLSKFSSFSIFQQSGSGTFMIQRYGGNTTSTIMSSGSTYSVKSEQKCKYLNKQTVSHTMSGTGQLVISYTW